MEVLRHHQSVWPQSGPSIVEAKNIFAMETNGRASSNRPGSGFFLSKFQHEENMKKALHDGPWFILNHFLSVQRWEPKFIAFKTQLTYSAIWIRLPELSTEFYDLDILTRVGNKIGKLLKIDPFTPTTSRGRYARICIEVPVEQPLHTHIYIGTHKQVILL